MKVIGQTSESRVREKFVGEEEVKED